MFSEYVFPMGRSFTKCLCRDDIMGVFFLLREGFMFLNASTEMSFYQKFPLWRGGIGILKKRNVSKKIIACI